jgi:glycerol-3-phosphate dehydrogenase
MYDIIIVGAGVIGCMIARSLSKYELKIIVLEKENDVSCGASKANSGIVHGGYDAKAGTLKGIMSRKGNRLYAKLNEELNFGYEACGSLVLAFSDTEIETLKALCQNGLENGIDDLKIISRDEVLEMEPYLNPEVLGALYCKSAGITSPYELTIALAENAVMNGVQLNLNSEVVKIEKHQEFKVYTKSQCYEGKLLINAAGAYSDVVAGFLGANDFTITPRRGEYIILNKNQGYLANP